MFFLFFIRKSMFFPVVLFFMHVYLMFFIKVKKHVFFVFYSKNIYGSYSGLYK